MEVCTWWRAEDCVWKALKAHPAAVGLFISRAHTHTQAADSSSSFELAYLYNFNQFSSCFIVCQGVKMCLREGTCEVLVPGKHFNMYS